MTKISKFIALLCRAKVRVAPAEPCYDISLLNSSFDHLQSILHETSHLATTLSSTLDTKEDVTRTLSTVLQLISDGIIIIDCNGMIQTWNNGAATIFGYSADEAIGKNINDVTSGQHLINCASPCQLNDIMYPVMLTHKNGTMISLELIVNAIRNKDGEIKSYVAVIRDITNRCANCTKNAIDNK